MRLLPGVSYREPKRVFKAPSALALATIGLAAHALFGQTPENGIHVNRPKVYDSRELTLMLDNLSAQLQGSNFINPASLAAALGNVQGFHNSDFSASFFANGGVGPGAANVFAGNPSGSTPSTGDSTSSGSNTSPTITINVAPTASTGAATTAAATPAASATLGPQPPALPTLQTAPSYTPTFGANSSDLLSDEVNLTYQVYNVSMLLDRSLTDRVYKHGSRLQAVVGFDIDLEPPKTARNSVAVVEVTAKMLGCDTLKSPDCEAEGKPMLVALMPEQGSHNAATLSQSAVGFSGAVASAVYSVGIAAQKRNQVFYLYRDMDTVSFQRTADDDKAIDFGWQFRPVLGKHSVDAGFRHLMVVIGLPSQDVNAAAPQLDIAVTTKWVRYDAKIQTTDDSHPFWHSLPAPGSVDYQGVDVQTSLLTQHDLGASISTVHWLPTDAANGVAVVEGNNFFPGTSVQIGPKVYQSSRDGLTIKSDKEVEVSLPLSVAISGGLVSGRYGEAQPLQSDQKSLPAGGISITNLKIAPQGEDSDELSIDFSVQQNSSHAAIDPAALSALNDPIVLVNNKPEPGIVRWWADTPAADGTVPSHLLTFVPSKDLEKNSPTVSVLFPFEGPQWKASMPIYNRALKVVRMGGDKSARLLISSLGPGEYLCQNNWFVQLEDGVAIHRTDVAPPGSTDIKGSKLTCLDTSLDILSLEVDAKALKPYHQFLLVDPYAYTKPNDPTSPKGPPRPPIAGDIPDAKPAPPAPSLDKGQKVSVSQFDTKPVTFTGKHLDLVTKVLFDKVALSIVKQEDKSIIISLSRQETEKAPADIQLQLLSDGNDPILAEVTVTPASKPGPTPQKGK